MTLRYEKEKKRCDSFARYCIVPRIDHSRHACAPHTRSAMNEHTDELKEKQKRKKKKKHS